MSPCAFLFPGQGAQYPGMGKDLADRFPRCREVLERVEVHLGLPLGEIMFSGTQERLDEDFTAQVAVYTVSCMVVELLRERGIQADGIAPYSSGLYAAVYAAGVMNLETGLTLMREADLCIRKTKVRSCMGVVLGLSPSEVEALCAETENVVEVRAATLEETLKNLGNTGES